MLKDVVLITGATRGIGLELAKCFAAAGDDLALAARSENELAEVALYLEQHNEVCVRTYPCDLAEPGAPAELIDRMKLDRLEVTGLVNNAGVGCYGPFAFSNEDMVRRMMQLNMTSLVELTRLCLPEMIEQGYGRILNVASTSAFQPGPSMAVYSATKAFVLSFTEALVEEVRRSGILVTVLCPGATQTDFHERSGFIDTRSGGAMMTAHEVARRGLRALMAGQPVVITGLTNTLSTQLPRFMPRSLVPKIVKRIM
jgi:short-subunit dehydrogenase